MANKLLDLDGLGRLVSKINTKYQQKLVSGSNIKTINNQSLLGSGNINISGGAAVVNPYSIDDSHIYLIVASTNERVGYISWYINDDDDTNSFSVRNPAFIINGKYYSQIAVSSSNGTPTINTGTIIFDYGSLWGNDVTVIRLN